MWNKEKAADESTEKSAGSNCNAGVWHAVGEPSLAGTAIPIVVAGESLNAALGPPACGLVLPLKMEMAWTRWEWLAVLFKL